MGATLAFDIGGTKIAYGVVSDSTPDEVHCTGKVPAQPQGSTLAAEFDKCVATALSAARAGGFEPSRIGIGAPGIVKGPQGTIVHAGPTAPGWQGTELEDIVAKHVELPVACHNDVRIWAFGEHHLGVGQELSGRVIYLSLGTGVGGALVDDGELLGGSTGSAGEFSELIVPDFRGFADRVENTCSGNSLARYYNAFSRSPDHTGRVAWDHPRKDGDIALPEIMDRYHQGDELAVKIIDGNLQGLGRTLAGLVFGLDLNAVVIGGGVAGIGHPIFSALHEGFAQWVISTHDQVPILPSRLGGFAPLVGAAAYARENA